MDKTPNTLLVGAQKAGTTSLYDWVAQHPQVLASLAVKDFPFFWKDDRYHRGINELTKLFPQRKNEKIILAGNVNDMYFESSMKRIRELNPDMRLLVCLRNPVERAYSAYVYAVQRGLEARSFKDAVEQELNGASPSDVISMSQQYYVSHGYYWVQIRRILKYFDQNRLHVVLFDDLKNEPQKVIQDVYRFLCIDDSFIPNLDKKNATQGGARFGRFNALIFKYAMTQPPWYRFLKKLFPYNTRYLVRGAVDKICRKKIAVKPMDKDVDAYLKKHYEKGLIDLSVFLKRDLSSWLE